MPEKEAAEYKCSNRIRGDNAEFMKARAQAGKQPVAIRTHEERQRVCAEQPPELLGEIVLRNKNGSHPKPERKDYDKHLCGVAQVNVQASDHPTNPDAEQSDHQHI